MWHQHAVHPPRPSHPPTHHTHTPPRQVYHYPNFHAGRDGAKLAAEVTHNLSRPTAWEAVMRIRCSRGLKVSSFHGHFFNRSTDLLALPTCDPDKAFAVQVREGAARGGGGYLRQERGVIARVSLSGQQRGVVARVCLTLSSAVQVRVLRKQGGDLRVCGGRGEQGPIQSTE